MQYPKISAILRDSKFSLATFKPTEIQFVEDRIITSKDKKGNTAFIVECLKRGGNFKVTPEEVVRQIFLHRLLTQYKYHKDHIRIEHPIRYGSDASKNRADIVIVDKDRPDSVYIIV